MAGPAPLFRDIHRLRSFAHSLKEQLERLPRQHKAQQARLATAQGALTAAQEKIKHLKVEASSKEKALKGKHEQIAKNEGKLNNIQSKKEYDAIQLEIAFAKTECGKLEDEILQALTDAEDETARLPGLEKALAAVKAEVAKFEADMAPKQATWQAELTQAQAKLQEVEPNLPKQVRPTYDRTVKALGHDGFASVKGRTCGGCQADIPAQDRGDLEDDLFVMCRSCGRILYLADGEKAPTGEE